MDGSTAETAARTFEDWQVVLLSGWDWPLWTAALVLAAAAVVLSARGYLRQRGAVRTLLVLLRLLAVGAVLLLALQPGLRRRSVTRVPNHVAILVDTSESMGIRDQQDQPDRLTRAISVLARSKTRLRSWRSQRHVNLHAFHAELVSWPGVGSAADGAQGKGAQGKRAPAAPRATGPATRIRTALEQLRERLGGAGGDLAGIVLISDGADNGRMGTGKLSEAHVRFVGGLRAPIYTVWTGGETVRDVAVGPVHADDFAFVRNAIKVDVQVTVSGLDVPSIPVRLSEGEHLIAERKVTVDAKQANHRVTFEFVPERVGKFVYTVTSPLQPAEALKDNNEATFVINVIRDRVRVLHLCGQPSWDQRFLRRLLKRDPNVDLVSFYILRTPASLSLVPPSELSLIPFPTQELFEKELGSFDLVILQNFNYGPYGIGAYLTQLRDFVWRGGGLAMVGGPLSYTLGGYARTPVAEVLPVHLPGPSGDGSTLLSSDEFRPAVTDRGRNHPILQLGPDRGATHRVLEALPALRGANRVGAARGKAVVLATHPKLEIGRRGRAMPVVAVRQVRDGRTMALTTDSLWRWAFASVGKGGTRQAYDRFWRNAVRWLIQDPELEYLRVFVQRDRPRPGQDLEITLRAYEPDYRPAAGVTVSYRVDRVGRTRRGNKRGRPETAVTDAAGEARVTYRPADPGAYRVAAQASIRQRKTRAAEVFVVDPLGVEQQQPRGTPALLKQLSALSGGRYLGQAEQLPDLTFNPPRVLRVNWTRDVELWNRWWSLALVVLLLSLEWIVRRRFGHF